MSVTYRCPGTTPYGRGQAETVVHADSCCAQFALMSPERRARTGVRVPDRAPGGDMPKPPRPTEITVRQLAQLVETMQYRATMYPDEEPPGAAVSVVFGPSHTEAEVLALYDLGRPYNLVVGWRRLPEDPEGES